MRTGMRRPAFTLVELLTVIAIISLLIGLLVPSLTGARDQAKRVSVESQISGLDKGCEMFNSETNSYPRSSGRNPFDASSYGASPGNVWLTGAQWLAVQLAGADLRGYVKPVSQNEAPPPVDTDTTINDKDWGDWYSINAAKEYPRIGPYMEPTPDSVMSPRKFKENFPNSGDLPASMLDGTDPWTNDRVPLFVDKFGFPLLYYKATPGAKFPISTGSAGTVKVGVYDHSDNAVITGNGAANGMIPVSSEPGWDVAGVGAAVETAFGTRIHPMSQLGYDDTKPDEWINDQPDSFGESILDKNIFDTTADNNKGKLWPRNAQRFLIISAGKDGRYGTQDDVRNFAGGSR